MDASQILLIAIAIVAANLPFLSERIFFVIPSAASKDASSEQASEGMRVALSDVKKHWGWRLLELVVFYFLVGGAAYLLEGRLGNPHDQPWQFYAITACLFLVFAYPGFVLKYLWNARGR